MVMIHPERIEGVNVLEKFQEAELVEFTPWKNTLIIEDLQGWRLDVAE